MSGKTMLLCPNRVHQSLKLVTYDEFDVPDITKSIDLKGDFSWTGLDIDVKDTQLETFKTNKELWTFVECPTACYVTETFDVEDKFVLFYRDQQGCVVWQYNLDDGKIYEYDDRIVSDTLEEFWLRMYIESTIFYNKPIESGPLEKVYNDYIAFYTIENEDSSSMSSTELTDDGCTSSDEGDECTSSDDESTTDDEIEGDDPLSTTTLIGVVCGVIVAYLTGRYLFK